MVQQNINAKAPLKFSGKIKIKIIKRYKYQGYKTVNLIPGQTHYTKNDSHVSILSPAPSREHGCHYTKNDSHALERVLEKGWRLNIISKRRALHRGKQGLNMC